MHSATSVIIPVRNGAAYVADAVTSVLAQLDQDDELIVVDDGSSDDTLSIVGALADARLRVLTTPGLGVSAARNRGLAAASGEFIAFLDHDDAWPESRHRAMLQMLSDNPALDAVYGRIRIRYEPGVVPSARFLELDGQTPKEIFVSNALYRRRIVDLVEGFAEDMRFGEDVDFNSRLREAGMKFAACDVDGLIHRRHAANTTNDQLAVRDSLFDVLRRKLARTRQGSISGI